MKVPFSSELCKIGAPYGTPIDHNTITCFCLCCRQILLCGQCTHFEKPETPGSAIDPNQFTWVFFCGLFYIVEKVA